MGAREKVPSSLDLSFKPNTDSKESYIFDSTMIQGVDAERELNDTSHEYLLYTGYESEGLRYYRHKYLISKSTREAYNMYFGDLLKESFN